MLRVPPGTQVFDEATGALIGDLRAHGERLVVAQGGKGGRGNIHFATSTDRAPRKAEPGTPGEERTRPPRAQAARRRRPARLPQRRQVVAHRAHLRRAPEDRRLPVHDAGAEPGRSALSGERSFVVADIPGLIEGAHAGAGLGDRFLRHLERTRLLVHLLDASTGEPGRTPLRDYEAMNSELALYDPALAARPQLVVLNKIDLPDVRKARQADRRAVRAARGSRSPPSARRPARGRLSCWNRSGGPCRPGPRRLSFWPSRVNFPWWEKFRKAEGIDHTCAA